MKRLTGVAGRREDLRTMLGMLKRHEVKILLKAGHSKTDVARLTGVSFHSVSRMAEEAPVDHLDDAAERMKRRIGRPSLMEDFRKRVVEILQEKADLPSLEVLRRVREAGYQGGKSMLYALVASLRPKQVKPLVGLEGLPGDSCVHAFGQVDVEFMDGSWPDAIRQGVFDWMRALLQGALHRAALAKELGHVAELDRLLMGMHEGRLSHRNKAMAILARERGISQSHASSFLHVSPTTVSRYWKAYRRGGTAALFARKVSHPPKSKDEGIKQAVFALLHTPPMAHGINRSTWRLTDLQSVLHDRGLELSKDVIPVIIKEAGYKWRKARLVLTSKDPQYKAKIEAIKTILSELKSDEAFFSIDEFGPFAVKETGGRKRVAPEESYTVPQWQKSKGHLIVTAALELSRNQVTHFYSEKKNTREMIKMMDLLRTQYRDCKIIYLSWDAASWHISKELFSKIKERNEEAPTHGYPIVKTAPLPAGAQFLNVIESVFSGMARAIIHNSDYHSLDAAKAAIDRHFKNRNEHFREHPKRAGRKIWGAERVESEFQESNNCKDPLYR
ncbi:MAG: IS630 family transposase [Terriglobia bacterium]